MIYTVITAYPTGNTLYWIFSPRIYGSNSGDLSSLCSTFLFISEIFPNAHLVKTFWVSVTLTLYCLPFWNLEMLKKLNFRRVLLLWIFSEMDFLSSVCSEYVFVFLVLPWLIWCFLLFSRFMNQYFLLIACLQLWPLITPVNPASTWGPLIFIFAVSATKEAWDDYNRYLSDKKANEKRVWIVRNGIKKQVNLPLDSLSRLSFPAMRWVLTTYSSLRCQHLFHCFLEAST